MQSDLSLLLNNVTAANTHAYGGMYLMLLLCMDCSDVIGLSIESRRHLVGILNMNRERGNVLRNTENR